MTKLSLTKIHDLAYRFVPPAAADERLYDWGPKSWWPAHEIGHFLIATPKECRTFGFGIDEEYTHDSSRWRYAVSREVAAMSVSQRLLRRTGNKHLADEEIAYTDETTLEASFESWCRRSVRGLLRANRIIRLPTTLGGLETVLTRKAREVGTRFYATKHAALGENGDESPHAWENRIQ